MAENLYGRSEPCEPTSVIKTEEERGPRRGPGLYDDLGRRIRGKYDGPKIDNYDKFRKCYLQVMKVVFSACHDHLYNLNSVQGTMDLWSYIIPNDRYSQRVYVNRDLGLTMLMAHIKAGHVIHFIQQSNNCYFRLESLGQVQASTCRYQVW